MRYTERHYGVAVIKDKKKHREAMEKLAKFEEMKDIPAMICDRYCKFPAIFHDEEDLEDACAGCGLRELLELLED